jgi:hypothetical protein
MIVRICAVAALVLTALALAAHAHATATDGTLTARVGPGSEEIGMWDSDGQPFDHLAPGTYTIEVDDRSTHDNFHLSGPGVDDYTTVAGTGTVTWTVAFTDGTYRVQSDAQPATLRFIFLVGDAQPTLTGPDVFPQLDAASGPGLTISLRRHGSTVHVVRPGDYRFKVRDHTAAGNFRLIGPAGFQLATGVRYVGTLDWVVHLVRGTYVYRSDTHPKSLRRTFAVR